MSLAKVRGRSRAFPCDGGDHRGASLREYLVASTDVPADLARQVLAAEGIAAESMSVAMLLQVRARLRVIEADAILEAMFEGEDEDEDLGAGEA